MTSDKSLTLSVPREHNDSRFCGIVERVKLNASANAAGAAWHVAGSQNVRVERNGDLKILCNFKMIIICPCFSNYIANMFFHLTFLFFN